MNQDQIHDKAMKILYQEVQVRLLQIADIKILSPYETQDSSSDDVQKLKTYATLSLEMILNNKKCDELKAQIKGQMENGLKLIEIFVKYPDKSDQHMIAEFWAKLEEYERMMLKKELCMLQVNQNEMDNNKNEAISMELEQEQILNGDQENEIIIENRNQAHLQIQEISLQVDIKNDLNEEKKDQKLGLIKKTIKKTPLKNPCFDKFMEKQNQAKDIKQVNKINKWEMIKKQKEEAALVEFERLREQNKK